MGRSSLAAKHCYIAASPEELEHEVVAAKPEFAIVAAGLEKGPHLPEVLEPQELLVGLGTKGVEKTFGHPEQGENRYSSSHLIIRGGALGSRDWLFLFGLRKV